MVYHIYFSQEGRSYSMMMFLGMVALYFLVQHLRISRKAYLFLAALFFALLFYTSYSSILFIILSQILWFYKVNDNNQKPSFYSFLIFIGLLLLFCIPWLMFLAFNYKGQSMATLVSTDLRTSFLAVLYDLIHDWVPLLPLLIISLILLAFFPVFSRHRTNGFIFLALFVIPVGGLYLFHKLFNIYHHFSSKYLINLLPLFLILTYLSLNTIEAKLERFNRLVRLKLLFLLLFISSNLVILPLYYSSEKQDLRGLVAYLRNYVQDGDKIVVLGGGAHLIGMVHYFGVYPEGRGYLFPAKRVSEKEIEYRIFLMNKDRTFMISNSITYWFRYLTEQNRLWIVIGKADAKRFQKDSRFTLKAYFDGSYLHYNKFPTDASMYLFLWDPKSPDEKGIDLPID